MLEAELQVIVDSLVGDFAEQGKVGNTDLLLLRRLEDGLLNLRFGPRLSSIAHIGDRLAATKASTLLLATNRTPRVSLERITSQYHSIEATTSGVS